MILINWEDLRSFMEVHKLGEAFQRMTLIEQIELNKHIEQIELNKHIEQIAERAFQLRQEKFECLFTMLPPPVLQSSFGKKHKNL